MKKIAYTTFLKTAIGMASIAFLVACGGSETDTKTTFSGNSSDVAGNNSEAINSANSSEIPALTLSALDNLPTIDVSQAENAANTPLIGNKEGTFNSLNQKTGSSTPITDPVLGFIVKYKNQSNNLGKSLGASNNTYTTQEGNATAFTNMNLTGASQILASGMSVGMANVGSKNNLQISFKANRYNASKVFSLGTVLDPIRAQKIAQEMQVADPNIEYVALNKIKRASYTPNDKYFTDYYLAGLRDASPFGVKAQTAWDTSNGAGVVVAVVDTGYRPHVDMAGRILPGYDFISVPLIANDSSRKEIEPDLSTRDNNAIDPGDWVDYGECDDLYAENNTPSQNSSWHGTHVAGTIAANANNKIGIAGLAYGAKILPVRVLGKCGGIDSDIADGIVWAAGGNIPGVPANKTPAKVINLSLGGYDSDGICDTVYQDAIATARSLGAVVVVAAGNSGANAATTTPANCANAITVGATNTAGVKADFSNFGTNVDISAPGVDILSHLNSSSAGPVSDNAYGFRSGTSMATPHVSAALALMFSANPRMTPEQAEQYIKQSVRPFATGGCTSAGGCGTGILDASKAVITYTGAHAPADFDGNSKTDLVYRKSLSSYDEIYLGYVNASQQTISKSFITSKSKKIVAIGDFNGDRRADLLEASTPSGKLANFIYMKGNKVSSIKTIAGLQPANSDVIGAADLNADGKDDLLLRNTSGDFIVALMPSNGSPNLSYTTVVNIPTSFVYKGTGDTNSDGKLEVFWQDIAANQLKVITMDGSTALSDETGNANGFIIEGIGHFINKTAASILVRDSVTNAVSIIFGHSGGTFNSAAPLKNTKLVPFVLPSNMVIANIGDYNGNGQDDILWRQTNSTKAGILSMSGLNYSSVALPALSSTLVVQGKP